MHNKLQPKTHLQTNLKTSPKTNPKIKGKTKRHSKTWLLLASMLASQAHAGQEYVNIQRMHYQESDSRMKIDFTTASILKDFGTDFTVSANVSKDVMSGATPVWDFASGASVKLNNLDESTGLIAFDDGGKANLDDFKFSNHEMEDVRDAGDISVTWRAPESRDELTVGVSTSREEDYKSRGLSAQYLHYLTPSKNRSITTGFSVLDNDAENRRTDTWDNAKYYNAQVGITQVFSPTQVASLSLFGMLEDGELTNPYQTVIRAINVGSASNPNHQLFLSPEKRPNTRRVFGVNMTGNQKLMETPLGMPVTLAGAYRVYQDNWGQTAHSLKGNAYVGNVDDYGRFMLGARVMQQSEASFFKDPEAKDNYFNQSDYASADERLGKMNGISAELGYEKRFLEHWRLITHASYQKQSGSTDLSFYWLTAGVRYDF